MERKQSLVDRLLRRLGSGRHDEADPGPGDRLRLSGRNLRVPNRGQAFAVEMGEQTLHVCPDAPPAGVVDPARQDFVVFDPDLYYEGIAHALRLAPGKVLAIDHREAHQELALGHPRDAFRRHLQISHNGETLDFRDPISELGTYLSLVDGNGEDTPFLARRRDRIRRVHEIYGGPVRPLPPEEALELLAGVNRLLMDDAYRKKDSLDNAGGLVELPVHLAPVIVGDLHGRVENLLTVLLENSILESLDRDEAVLVLLGDAVHPEEEGRLDDMESSVLTMDLILRLKQRYPRQVFFLVGNHDSFSPDVMKGGVPQSLLWEQVVTEKRGEEYRRQLAVFYRQSPLMCLSRDFVACHAGPPRTSVSIDTLVEARQFPDLVHQLTWNRIKSGNWPVGYTRGDVKRLRKSLQVDEDLPFIVAHYPQDSEGTVWLNAGEIPDHHIIYSARPGEVGLFTRVKGTMVPQIYPSTVTLEGLNRGVPQTI